MRIKILGKYWNLEFTYAGSEKYGDCDSPDTPNKQIRVAPSLKDREEMETILHEVGGHAADWSKDEEWVTRWAHDLSIILYDQLGYRRT